MLTELGKFLYLEDVCELDMLFLYQRDVDVTGNWDMVKYDGH